MGLFANIQTVIARPGLGIEYLGYLASCRRNGGTAVRRLRRDVSIGGILDFSEYHAITDFLTPLEESFICGQSLLDGHIVDVGANIGVVSAMLARAYPGRIVHAFEPNPSSHQTLVENIARNGIPNIRAVQAAVGSSDGTLKFYAPSKSRGIAQIASRPGEDVIDVQVLQLSKYFAQNAIDRVSFMKVDVEGFEAGVFEGAKEHIQSKRIAMIYYEVSSQACNSAGTSLNAASELLLEFGYRIQRLGEDGSLAPADPSKLAGDFYENWVATPA